MGVEELLYLCCYFHMSRMALGDRFAYINQHCGPLFSELCGVVDGRGVWPAWAGKGLVQPARAPFTIICN